MIAKTISELKANHDLYATVSSDIQLRRSGQNWVGRCPFHNDAGRPNLVVFPDTQTWACFVCEAQGDVLDWLVKYRKMDLRAAMGSLGLNSAKRAVRLQQAAKAHPDELNAAYQKLIQRLPILSRHTKVLREHGLGMETVFANGYRTFRAGRVPFEAKRVPGFFSPVPGITATHGPTGLLIPVRDLAGRIIACQIRPDRTAYGKYMWLSTPHMVDGASSGAPCHVSRGGEGTVYITEGVLKSDVLRYMLDVTVIGIPGVALWMRGVDLIRELHPDTVVIAFDQDTDPGTREVVDQAAARLQERLATITPHVMRASWEGPAKGIDDALLTGARLTIE